MRSIMSKPYVSFSIRNHHNFHCFEHSWCKIKKSQRFNKIATFCSFALSEMWYLNVFALSGICGI